MPRLIDKATGQPVELDPADVAAVYASGKYDIPEGETITVRNEGARMVVPLADHLGGSIIPDSRVETTGEQAAIDAREDVEEEYAGPLQGVAAFGEGALDSLTFGGYGALQGDSFTDRASVHPTASGAGQIAGLVAPALLTGGASTGVAAATGAGRLARAGQVVKGAIRATPAGLTMRAGSKIMAKGAAVGTTGARVASGVAAGGFEGAIFNSGHYLSSVAMEDKELSAEAFVGAMGKGALWGAAIGGTMEVAGSIARAGKRRWDTAQAERHFIDDADGVLGSIKKAKKSTAKTTTIDRVTPKKLKTKKANKKRQQQFEDELSRQMRSGEDMLGHLNGLKYEAERDFARTLEVGAANRANRTASELAEAREGVKNWLSLMKKKTASPGGMSVSHVSSSGAGKGISPRATDKVVKFSKEGADIVPIERFNLDDYVPVSQLDDDAVAQLSRYEQAQYAHAKELLPSASPKTAQHLTEDIIKPYEAAVAASKAATAKTTPTLKSMGTAAADAAGYIEALQTLGLPLPDVDNVPVIGPLLGAYLKWRGFSRGSARFMSSGTSKVAEKSAAMQNKVTDTIDSLLRGAEKTARTVKPTVVPLATLKGELFAPRGTMPRILSEQGGQSSMYQRRLAELEAAVADEEGTKMAVRERVDTSDPDLAEAIASTFMRKLKFLHSKAPRDPRPPNAFDLGRKFVPDAKDLYEWSRYVRAVEDPSSVLEDAVDGKLSLQGAEALRTVYPQMFADIQTEIIDRMDELKAKLPFHTRVQLSTLFDVAADESMRPEFIKRMQDGYKQQQEEQSQPQSPPSGNPVVSEQATLAMHRRMAR